MTLPDPACTKSSDSAERRILMHAYDSSVISIAARLWLADAGVMSATLTTTIM